MNVQKGVSKESMDTTMIAAELRTFIRQRYGVPESDPDFDDNVDLFNYGYIDSVGAVALIAFIEKEFGITFTETDWATTPLGSIRQISSFVVSRKDGDTSLCMEES